MEKRKLKILEVDRLLKQGEKSVRDIFNAYRSKDYDIIVFPWRKDKTCTEVIVFSYSFFDELKYFFEISNKGDEDDPFYDFDLEGMETQTFYDILDEQFEIEVNNLTDVEK
ncbi:MAG: hypothetical protein KAQ63_01210 [Candidatus Moranbacteria bacterium]|nr:hypothetical protein [Candidatus Moranbacteria bacterium]